MLRCRKFLKIYRLTTVFLTFMYTGMATLNIMGVCSGSITATRKWSANCCLLVESEYNQKTIVHIMLLTHWYWASLSHTSISTERTTRTVIHIVIIHINGHNTPKKMHYGQMYTIVHFVFSTVMYTVCFAIFFYVAEIVAKTGLEQRQFLIVVPVLRRPWCSVLLAVCVKIFFTVI